MHYSNTTAEESIINKRFCLCEGMEEQILEGVGNEQKLLRAAKKSNFCRFMTIHDYPIPEKRQHVKATHTTAYS